MRGIVVAREKTLTRPIGTIAPGEMRRSLDPEAGSLAGGTR